MGKWIATAIFLIGACGLGFMLYCIRRDCLTERNLAIIGSLVIVNVALLVALLVIVWQAGI